MKGPKTIFIAAVVLAAAGMAVGGCGLFAPREVTNEQVLQDLQEIQAMLPVLQAGLSLAMSESEFAEAQSTGIMTFSPESYSGAPDENPRYYFTEGTADPSTGAVRYPAAPDTYIDDFYGTSGNKAYFTLTEYSESPALYRVDLYIFPTLSSEVKHVYERYLVTADPAATIATSAWAPRDDAGAVDYTYYLDNRTVYFDGRVQTHEVIWTRYVNETYYGAISVPDDPMDPLYDYPADPDAAEPERNPAAAADGRYSAYVVSSIADPQTTVVEFYTETPDKSAVSYVEKDYQSGSLSDFERTVRRYSETAGGGKTVRARTTAEVYYPGLIDRTVVVTETVDISTSAQNLTEYTSTTKAYVEGDEGDDYIYMTEVALEETGVDTDEYAGTMTYTRGDAESEYSLTLDAEEGLRMSGSRGNSGKFKDVMSRREFRLFVVELASGGEFTGKLKGGQIQGLYKLLSAEVDVNVSLAALLAIGAGIATGE